MNGYCSIAVDSFVEAVEAHSQMSARHRSFSCAICTLRASDYTADSNAPAVGGGGFECIYSVELLIFEPVCIEVNIAYLNTFTYLNDFYSNFLDGPSL